MRGFALFLAAAAAAQAQTGFSIRPQLITECAPYGLGHATLAWKAPAGPVQIRIGAPDGIPMTGPEPSEGTASTTGDWIPDGMVFYLVDLTGRELARVTARVACAPLPKLTEAALASGSYFPLHIGNEWVYRTDSRVATSSYSTLRVTRAELIDGKAWFVLESALPGSVVARYRDDGQGRIWRLNQQGREELYLDPSPAPDPSAVLTVVSRGVPYSGELGTFPDTVSYRMSGGLGLETGSYARGIGLVASRSTLLTGSSGGFVSGNDLVYARIDGRLQFAAAAPSIGIAAEQTVLDVSGGRVKNCAIPCYFVACSFGGADPPGTYKPCFQARIKIEPAPADPRAEQPPLDVEVSLVNAAGQTVFQASQAVAPVDRLGAMLYRQVPLYTAPNQPLEPGNYRLRAAARLGSNEDPATAEIPVRIQ